MSKNLLKQDIKLMLNQLVESLDDDKKVKYDGVVAQIYNEIENVPIIDLYVTREYLKDSINSILTASSKKKLEIKKENKSSTVTASTFRVVTDSEGEFSVIMTDEAGEEKIILRTKDQTVADAFKQKQAAAGEEVVPALGAPTDIEEDIGGIPEEDLPNTEVEKPNEGEEFTEEPELETSEEELPSEEFEEGPVDEVGDLNLEAIESATNRAEDLIGAIDNAIDIIPNLDAIVQLVEFKITLQDKKDSVLNADPSNANIQTMIQSLENILEEVESKAIDIINKNSPNDKAVDELVSAGEVHDEVKDIEEKAEKESSEELLSNELSNTEKTAVTGEVDVDAEEIEEETLNDEELESDMEDFEDELKVEDKSVEEINDERLDKIEILLNEIMAIVDENVDDDSEKDEVEEKLEDIKMEAMDVLNFNELLEDLEDESEEESFEEDITTDDVNIEETLEEDDSVENENFSELPEEKTEVIKSAEQVEDNEEVAKACESVTSDVKDTVDDKGFVVEEEVVDLLKTEENASKLPDENEDKEAIIADETEALKIGDTVEFTKDFLWHEHGDTMGWRKGSKAVVTDIDKETGEPVFDGFHKIDSSFYKVVTASVDTVVSSKKVDETKNKSVKADEKLSDGTVVSVSWIKKQLKDAGIEFSNVKKTASGEFEIVSMKKFKDNKIGKEWNKYEDQIYKVLKKAGWKNKDSIFIV